MEAFHRSPLQTSTLLSKTLTFSSRSSEPEICAASATPHRPPCLRLEGDGFVFVSLLRDEVALSCQEGSAGEERDRKGGSGVEVLSPALKRGDRMKSLKGGLEHSVPVSDP